MSKLLIKSLAVGLIAATSIGTGYAAPRPQKGDNGALSRMRKVKNPRNLQWNIATEKGKKIAPGFTSPTSDVFQYLDGPDGTEWYAVCKYDVEYKELEGGYVSEPELKGYNFTVYDNNFNEVGTVSDAITFENGEIRCSQVQMDITVTKKFFNYDDKYEVMVAMSMNMPDYTVTTKTKVYSLTKGEKEGYDKPIAVIPGYPVDAINVAADKWSEDFFITFLTEKLPDPDGDYKEYIDYLAGYYQVLSTYTKATTGAEARVLHCQEIQNLRLPGDQMNSPMMLTQNVDGKFTITYAQYEKSFFVDPSGMSQDDSMVPDNSLVIDVYQLNNNYPKTLDLISSTKIAAEQKPENSNVLYSFYGIGNLGYSNDVDFKHYGSDGRPCFVVSVDDYQISDDDNYNSSYYVYDSEGNKIKTLAENTYNFVKMSDIPGQEPQAMFIHTGDEMVFSFVDLYSGTQRFELDQMYRGHALTTSFDRTQTATGYAYACALGFGEFDENNNLLAPVIWFDDKGEMTRLDMIPAGAGVELAQIYISKDALSPYVFNTDSTMEYMMLVKRRVGGASSALQEELLIASVEKGEIFGFRPDEEKGAIRMVYLMGGDSKQLVILYDNDSKYTADSYKLPFTRFAGGTGTASDPYQIATAGDFCQMASAPGAHYVIVSDIDCGGVTVPGVKDFTGSIDGKGHTVSNLALSGSKNVSLFETASKATFKNINFYDCSIDLEGSGEAALLCSNAVESKFENISVRRLKVRGDSYIGTFGGLVARMWMHSDIKGCQVAAADIYLPSCEMAGGVLGEMRTGSNVAASAFIGKIEANSTLGGMVGSTVTGDETIVNCHVDATLKAQNTVGGIVGFMKRSKVWNNYVEGSIEVTEPYKWTKALSAGGVAGELEGDWEGIANIPVTHNIVGLGSITYPELDLKEDYPHQTATVHRIVGRTSYNVEPEIEDYDENDNPIYKDKVVYETGVINNIVVSDLANVDSDFADKTIEGTTVDKYEVDPDMLSEKYGFAYGNDVENPWNIMAWNAYDPELYFENIVYMPKTAIDVKKGDIFSIEAVIISRDEVSVDDIVDGFLCEYNEGLLEMTGNMDYTDSSLSIEFKALAEGATDVKMSILSGSASCAVNVNSDTPGSVDGVIDGTQAPVYADGKVTAPGCRIVIYDMQGRQMASGNDSVSTDALPAGVYVATATDADGVSVSVKIVK